MTRVLWAILAAGCTEVTVGALSALVFGYTSVFLWPLLGLSPVGLIAAFVAFRVVYGQLRTSRPGGVEATPSAWPAPPPPRRGVPRWVLALGAVAVVSLAAIAVLLTLGNSSSSNGPTTIAPPSETATITPSSATVKERFQLFASAVASADFDAQYDVQVPPSRQSVCPRSLITGVLKSLAETNPAQMKASEELWANAEYVGDTRSGTDRAIVNVKVSSTGEQFALEFVREDGQWYFNDPQVKLGTHPECSIDGPTPTSSPILNPLTASPVQGYTSFHSARFGYSIQFPSGWNAEPSASFVYQGQTLYADIFAGPEESNFTTNVNISGGPTNAVSREDLYAQDVASAETSHSDTRAEDVQLLGQPAKRLTYTAGSLTNQAPFDQQQIIVVYADKEWVLTLSTALGKLDLYQGTFETVTGTFAPD